ncbi:MAG TPA: formyltetrahydrofolate deformylase [Rubrobacteraceae bacterium]|nr:formyltetrahydrofolate deformylase [Rubrobacteraceae bacterium]
MRNVRDLGDPERVPAVSYNLRLLISCPDKKGLIAAISSFIAMHDGNILSADQYVSDSGTFFMRLEIEGEGFGLGRDEFAGAFAPLARRHRMEWHVSHTDTPKRMAILVSRYDHCLIDLLWRWDSGELDAEIPLVVSNHPDLASRAEIYGIPFHHLPVTQETKSEQEGEVLDLLFEHGVDVVVLARYMQILSPKFVDAYPSGIINIHHSFLPAFAGADPYRRAHDRGVKTIGATAHYVTEELDAGPIIHQDVAHVTHRDTVEDLVRLGREVERRVLARAVRWHLEDRILVDGNRSVVFE